MRRLLSAALAAALCACAAQQAQTPPTSGLPSDPPDLRERGLLLLLADRRIYEPFTIETIRLQNENLHANLADTLGRIGDGRGRAVLHALLEGRPPEVRRAAAFALVQLADSTSVSYLLRSARDPDVVTAAWSVAALARLEVGLATVVEAVAGLPAEAQWKRLLPGLFRFPAEQVLPVARQGLGLEERELRAMAAYALAREPAPQALPELRRLLADPDPWMRGWGARALGQVGGREDVERLRPLLDDPEAGPAIQALRATHRLVRRGVRASPPEWRPRLLELHDDPRPGVAVTALASSSVWLLDESLGRALAGRAESGEPAEREAALQALAEAGDPRALDLATGFASSSRARARAWAARAAATLGELDLLTNLFGDGSPLVRLEALAGLLAAPEEGALRWAHQALSDTDPAVRAAALEWLTEHPLVSVEDLSRAIVGPDARQVVELELFGARALAARGIREPLERGLAVQNLESLARVGEYPARREAADGLERLARPRPAVGPAQTRKTAATYMEIVRQTERVPLVEIHTPHGRLRVKLDVSRAPMTCLSFLQLARQGFYDGLEFHRVVPDFVVQAGDPRGDGWGGPGYTLRDELSRLPFERGTLGMASSGPDTAGSQFFITLSRQPHLDGRYTTFGRVVEGDSILDRIMQGDRLERVVEIP